MDAIIERSVKICFPLCPFSQQRVSKVLFDFWLEPQKIDKLQILALKIVMEKEMMRDDLRKFMYFLIFKIPIKVSIRNDADWQTIGPVILLMEGEQRRKLLDFTCGPINDNFKNVLIDMRPKDPELSLAFLQHYNPTNGRFKLTMRRNKLEASISWFCFFEGKRKGWSAGTFWTERFLRMAMSRGMKSVEIVLEDNLQWYRAVMLRFVNRIISSLNWGTPENGWKTAIETKSSPVYKRTEDRYLITFDRVDNWKKEEEGQYLGYIRRQIPQ